MKDIVSRLISMPHVVPNYINSCGGLKHQQAGILMGRLISCQTIARHADRHTHVHKCIQTEIQTHRTYREAPDIHRPTDIHTDIGAYIRTYIRTYRQTNSGRTDGRTDGRADGRTDGRIANQTYIHTDGLCFKVRSPHTVPLVLLDDIT